MPMSSAGLSFVPNVSIANSLTNGGAASMTRSPTSSTGERQARFEAGEELGDAERDAGGHEPGQDREDPARPAASPAAQAVRPSTSTGGSIGWMVTRRFATAAGRMVRSASGAQQAQHGALDGVAGRVAGRAVAGAEPAQRRGDRRAAPRTASTTRGSTYDPRATVGVLPRYCGDVDHRRAHGLLAARRRRRRRRPTRRGRPRRARCRATCGSPSPTRRRRRRP